MKPIIEKGFEHYLVDIDGNVYNSLNNNKRIKSWPNKNTGYHLVVLRNGIKTKGLYVHRLVAQCYLPNLLNLPEVNHKDKNRSNNSLSNLEWISRSENMKHAYSNKNGGKLFNKIINDLELLNKGIEQYKLYGKIESASNIWNCSTTLCRKILIHNNIEIYKKNIIPLFVKKQLLNVCKLNPNWKHRHLIKYANDVYGINLTRSTTYSIIKNKDSLFSITKESKNLVI